MQLASAFDIFNKIITDTHINQADEYVGVSSFINILAKFFVTCGVGLSVVAIAYGSVQMATSSGDIKNAEKAQRAILWGAVGLLVSILAFVLVKVLLNTAGVSGVDVYTL